MAAKWDDDMAELADLFQDARDEFHRYQAIEQGIAAERDPDALLN